MEKVRLSLILSTIAITISVVAIWGSLEQFSPGDTAFTGWVVAVLSTLVLVLIGWNIYTMIDVKRIMDDNRSLKQEVNFSISLLNKEIGLMNLAANMTFFDLYYIKLVDDNRNILFKFLLYGAFAIRDASGEGDFKTCNLIVKSTLEVIIEPEILNLSGRQIKEIYKALENMKEVNNIDNYIDYMRLLSRINIKN